jgi:hypothetical protein
MKVGLRPTVIRLPFSVFRFRIADTDYGRRTTDYGDPKGRPELANFDFDYLMLGLTFVKECTSP